VKERIEDDRRGRKELKIIEGEGRY